MQERHPTAKRIIEVALRLFADRGIEATPITKIEEAAGLAPGSGAFYKHFKTKADVIRAARDDMASDIVTSSAAFEALDELDLPNQLRLIAIGMLMTYDARRDLVLTGIRLPNHDDTLDRGPGVSTSDAGLDWFQSWLERLNEAGQAKITDPRATGAILLGGIFTYWLSDQLRGGNTWSITRDRLVEAWADLARAAIQGEP